MRRPFESRDRQDAGPATSPPRSFDAYDGTAGDDIYTGTDGDDTISGGNGSDELDGAGGDDTIHGDDGNDTLRGGSGVNLLDAGDGYDRIYTTGGSDAVDGGADLDFWDATFSDQPLAVDVRNAAGTVSNGTTFVNVEYSTLHMGEGDDAITSDGSTNVTFDGGSGYDTAAFDFSALTSRLTYTIDVDAAGEISLGSVNSASNIEQLSLRTGSGFGRIVIEMHSRDGSIVIDDSAGRSTLVMTIDEPSTTFSEFRNGSVSYGSVTASGVNRFQIRSMADDTTIALRDGRDRVNSHGQHATISTGVGNDTVIAALTAGTSIDGGIGHDRLSGTLLGHVTFWDASFSLSNGAAFRDFERLTLSDWRNHAGENTLVLTTGSRIDVYAYNKTDVIQFDASAFTSALAFTGEYNPRGDRYAFGSTTTLGTASASVVGSAFDDTFTLDLQVQHLTGIDGGAGHDTFTVDWIKSGSFIVNEDGTISSTYGEFARLEQFDILVDLYSGSRRGPTTVRTGDSDDTITVYMYNGSTFDLGGGGGDDTITAYGGIGRMHGGEGNDVIGLRYELHSRPVDTAGNTVDHAASLADFGGDQLYGDAGDDMLSGLFGSVLHGGPGDDILNGSAASEYVTASYLGAPAGVQVSLAIEGRQDTGAAGFDTLIGIGRLDGSDFDDHLTGDDFSNTLFGNAGDDRLEGGDSYDQLIGGAGADRMTGGAYVDVFYFEDLGDIDPSGQDIITDFNHAEHDRISLADIDPSAKTGDQAFTFIGTADFSGDRNLYEVRVEEHHSGASVVQFDIDHDGKSDLSFLVHADASLTASDFNL